MVHTLRLVDIRQAQRPNRLLDWIMLAVLVERIVHLGLLIVKVGGNAASAKSVAQDLVHIHAVALALVSVCNALALDDQVRHVGHIFSLIKLFLELPGALTLH